MNLKCHICANELVFIPNTASWVCPVCSTQGSSEDQVTRLEARITELEKLLKDVVPFQTNIRIDGTPKPVCLLVKDLSGTLAPPAPKPTLSVVTHESTIR